MTTTVRLPLSREHAPRYPARCVVCGLPDPRGAIEFRTLGLWHSGGRPWRTVARLFRKPLAVRAPACPPCASDLRARRWKLRAARWCSAVLGGLAVIALLRGVGFDPGEHWYGGEVLGLVAAVLAIAVLVPLEFLLGVAFDVAIRERDVAYEFADRELAEQFARANDATIED